MKWFGHLECRSACTNSEVAGDGQRQKNLSECVAQDTDLLFFIFLNLNIFLFSLNSGIT